MKTIGITGAIFLLTFTIYFLSSPGPTAYDHFTRLAQSFLQLKTSVNPCPEYLEHMYFNNNCYYVFPPLPAIILMPLVAMVGLKADQRIVAIIFGAGIGTLYWIGLKKHFEKIRLWMVLLVSFGSLIWFLSSIGSSWYFAQLVSSFFLTWGVFEAINNKQPTTLRSGF